MAAQPQRRPQGEPQGERPVRVFTPTRVAEDLSGLAGMWVAVKDGRVIEAGRTPDAVGMRLRARNIRDAAILRVPGEGEPDLVGIG
jgi:hypothetical protein